MLAALKNIISSKLVLYNQSKKAYHIERRLKQVSKGKGLVIIPCDPESIVGSRGDEAMITAVIGHYRKNNPQSPVYIISQGPDSTQYINNANLGSNVLSIECWNGAYAEERIYDKIIELNPSDAVVIGADCMDGAYSNMISFDLVFFYNILKQSGINVRITGFSFNGNPTDYVIKVYKHYNTVTYPLRDALSLERFKHHTKAPGILVADVAFLLNPDTGFEEYNYIKEWVESRKHSGQQVIAFNFHPMLRQYSSTDDVKQDALFVADNLKNILNRHPDIDLLLLPHDDRNRINDATMLNVVYQALSDSDYNNRVIYLQKVPRASQLKAIAALMDGVISSRMHLAIAALGSEVPVMVASYQGKFHGLFKHFGLPESLILEPDEFCSSVFCDKFDDFRRQLPALKATITSKLPDVIALALKNFSYE